MANGVIYTDDANFQEIKRSSSPRSWRLACHESELHEPYDFRTIDHAESPLLVSRGASRLDGRPANQPRRCDPDAPEPAFQ